MCIRPYAHTYSNGGIRGLGAVDVCLQLYSCVGACLDVRDERLPLKRIGHDGTQP